MVMHLQTLRQKQKDLNLLKLMVSLRNLVIGRLTEIKRRSDSLKR
jgi:hypothetical protein